tara:strand:- start:949 stop:2469 length:1521 start_codon:yes stop_codon:yes gene_type:complete
MFNVNYNPDVLTCLANLSNDEVFTPPDVANKMLDQLPKELWIDKNTTFLDPCTKSGIFLREITKRLLVGLEDEIPVLQERINHILTKQVFGIGITELTALLTRRSLYCSKNANQEFSITDAFNNNDGNILYKNIEHKWKNLKCEYCGASKDLFNRQDFLEQHAYNFIHTENPKELFNMKFDVIIGNPPYQMSDGGGRDSSAVPLYQKFVENAIKLNPANLSMIIPARWYTGGKGLDSFRKKMINDRRLKELHDFQETSDIFPGLNIRAGVCYFLWQKNYDGDCKVVNYFKNEKNTMKRRLSVDGFDMLIRNNESINILNKVLSKSSKFYGDIVYPRNVFGFDGDSPANKKIFPELPKTKKNNTDVFLYRFGNNGFIPKSFVKKNRSLKNGIKVIVSKASPGGDTYPHKIISEPLIAYDNEVFSETYLLINRCENEKSAKNLIKYMRTYFFRFMMSLVKNTQNISRSSFIFVPTIDLSIDWDDQKLFKYYNISEHEQNYIKTQIKEM